MSDKFTKQPLRVKSVYRQCMSCLMTNSPTNAESYQTSSDVNYEDQTVKAYTVTRTLLRELIDLSTCTPISSDPSINYGRE